MSGRGPTNSAGIVTLFEHRPFDVWCDKHDIVGGGAFWRCSECVWEWKSLREAREREQRVSEMAEAFGRIVQAGRVEL